MRCVATLIHSWAVVTVPALAACISDTSGQDVLIRGDTASCARCRLILEERVALGSGSAFLDPGVSEPNGVVRATDGSYYLVHAFDLTRIQVYDAAGRYTRSIGRGGRGPGEFLMIRHLRGDGRCALHVLDPRNARWTVMGPDGRVLREATLGLNPRSIAMLEDGNLIAAGQFRTRDRVGYLFHVIDTAGQVVHSFDEHPYRLDASSPQRAVAPASSHTFWAAHATEYRLDEWRTNGERVRSIVRDASWFRPHLSARTYTSPVPQQPRIDWIHRDREGLLWVFVRVQDARFRETQTGEFGFDGRLDRFYDTVVEVLDPGAGRVIASNRFDHYFTGFAAPDELVSYRVTDDNIPLIEVWQVTIRKDH